MDDWTQQLRGSIGTGRELADMLPVAAEMVDRVAARYPVRIPPYVLSLIESPGDPIWRQFVPDESELAAGNLPEDPFKESIHAPLPGLIHRYTDRVLLLVTRQCAAYCRHCTRKRETGWKGQAPVFDLHQAVSYIRSDQSIRDVILSGGDPLLLSDRHLAAILNAIADIPHVQILRIHTRTMSTLPHRITEDLTGILQKFQPLYVVTQFNHARELTPMAVHACGRLVDAGIPLLCQSVLLSGVNDDPDTMEELLFTLLKHRVRPYYLHHPDPVQGTAHFRVSVEKGLEIMAAVRERMSGIGVPQYVADTAGAAGKVPLCADYVRSVCQPGVPIPP